MILGKVVGTVVTTISHPHYKNRRLLVVQPLTLPGDPIEGDFVALDNTHAGIGGTVLVNREGNGALCHRFPFSAKMISELVLLSINCLINRPLFPVHLPNVQGITGSAFCAMI